MAYTDDDKLAADGKPAANGLSETQLSAILSQQITLAKSHDKSVRSTPREKALDYFFGRMDAYVPPETNRSKVVSRDVADTISRMLPGIIRVFTASGQMAIVEPVGPEDEQAAEEATEALNYIFWKDNKGYQVVYDGTWDALLHGNGIIKTFYDDTPVYSTSFHTGLTEDQVAELVGDDDVDVLQKTEKQEQFQDPQSGAMIPVTLFDLKIRRKTLDGKVVIVAIPNEDFLIDDNAIDTDEAAFTDHWQRVTRSSLVQMGYDKDKVASIPEATRAETPEEQARRMLATPTDAPDKSMQLVDYHECFVRIDVDDDGEAELIRACAGGTNGEVLLDWEVWEDEHPFDDVRCEPIPHRWEARSVTDSTIDIQDVKSVLLRQFLNGTYWANNPQRAVIGKVKNPDQLDNPTFGGTIMIEVGGSIENLTNPDVGANSLQGLEYMDQVRQARTGVSRQSMALDPETLTNQSATAANLEHDAGYSQTELVARNMADGWGRVFRKLMRLTIKHQEQPRQIMLANKKVLNIDPRYWNADMNVTINVGLGTGSRDRDLQMLGQVLNTQLMLADRFMTAGAVDDAIDLLPKIIDTMVKMAESAGIKNAESFYPDFTEQKVAQLKQLAQQRTAQPDPKMQIEQMKLQSAQQIQASEMQSNQIKAQAEMQKSAADAQVKLMQAHGEARQAQLEAQLAQAELQIRQLEIASKNDTERWKAELAAAAQIAAAQAKAGFEQQAAMLQAGLDSELGFQEHQQNLAEADQAHQHSLAQQAAAPKPVAPAQGA